MLHACILLRQYNRTIFERVISPFNLKLFINSLRGHRGRDRMVVGFTTAKSALGTTSIKLQPNLL
jgi:hypothetical protein